jgi:ATP-binding cassette subfamily B (MDR/TAP) protein 1
VAFTAARTALAPMLEVINRKPLIDGMSEEGERPEEKSKGEIELKDVDFAYPSRPDILVCKVLYDI